MIAAIPLSNRSRHYAPAVAHRRELAERRAERRATWQTNFLYELRRIRCSASVASVQELFRSHGLPVPAATLAAGWLDGRRRPTLRWDTGLAAIFGVWPQSLCRPDHRRERNGWTLSDDARANWLCIVARG